MGGGKYAKLGREKSAVVVRVLCDVGVAGGLTCGIWAVFGVFIFEVGGEQIHGGNDSKKGKGKGKKRSRYPGGMTERKAKAKEEADSQRE